MFLDIVKSIQDKNRFTRIVRRYIDKGEGALNFLDLDKFYFEKYHVLCRIFYTKVSEEYWNSIDVCYESERLYSDIHSFINNENEENYLKFYYILLLNELKLDCEWLKALDEDLPFRRDLVSREVRNTFEIRGLQ